MAKFGSTSLSRLGEADYRLRRICHRAIRVYDFTILETYRSYEQQQALLDADPPKTTLAPGQSKHNQRPSLAIDIAPWPIDWNDPKRFIFLAGIMFTCAAEEGVKLRWGGNWDGDLIIIDDQSFDDLPHFELV